VDDKGTNWDWSITYVVTQAQSSRTRKRPDDRERHLVQPRVCHCVNFIMGVANAAGISLPDLVDYNAPVIGPSNAIIRIPRAA